MPALNLSKKQLIIAVSIAILYLAVSFLTHAWAWTWLIWVGYAIYRFVDERARKSPEDNKSDIVSR